MKISDESGGSLRKRIYIGIGFIAILGVLLPAFFLRDKDGQSELKRCNSYCQKEYGINGVLDPIISNQLTKKTDYQGPWKCTCPR
jgi:hypothetical protein